MNELQSTITSMCCIANEQGWREPRARLPLTEAAEGTEAVAAGAAMGTGEEVLEGTVVSGGVTAEAAGGTSRGSPYWCHRTHTPCCPAHFVQP